MRKLLADPDDTSQVFVIIESLSGRNGERTLRRFRRHPIGARILCERPRLLAALSNRSALEALPAGSLGRAYLTFIDREKISPAELVQASAGRVRRPASAELELVRERLRDQHDLWHVVTGYQGDLIGEAALLAFSFAQTRNPGVGFIVAVGLLRLGRLEQEGARRLVLAGLARGLRARWLPAQDWESLLPLPLDTVRDRLGVGAPPNYVPVRTLRRAALIYGIDS